MQQKKSIALTTIITPSFSQSVYRVISSRLGFVGVHTIHIHSKIHETQLRSETSIALTSKAPSNSWRQRPLDRALSSNPLKQCAGRRPSHRCPLLLLSLCNSVILLFLILCHLRLDFHLAVVFVLRYPFLPRRVAFFFDAIEYATELGEPLEDKS